MRRPGGMTPTDFHCLSNVATKLARYTTGDRDHEDSILDPANYLVLMAAVKRRTRAEGSR